jgi:hypothetical protein
VTTETAFNSVPGGPDHGGEPAALQAGYGCRHYLKVLFLHCSVNLSRFAAVRGTPRGVVGNVD